MSKYTITVKVTEVKFIDVEVEAANRTRAWIQTEDKIKADGFNADGGTINTELTGSYKARPVGIKKVKDKEKTETQNNTKPAKVESVKSRDTEYGPGVMKGLEQAARFM